MIQDILPHTYDNAYHPQSPQTGDYVFSYDGNNVLLNKDEKFFQYQDLPENLSYTYLFTIDQTHFFLTDLKDFYVSSLSISHFRSYDPQWLAFAAVTGWQIYNWMKENQFCGKCGTPMQQDEKERAMRCPSCNHIVYPKIMPAVIVGILNKKDELLVTQYAFGNYNRYALVAGFTEIGETIEECVKREVMEEVGLKVTDLRYYKSQPWSFSSTLLFGFFATVDGDDTITIDESELRLAKWVDRNANIDTGGNISLTSEMMQQYLTGKVSSK